MRGLVIKNTGSWYTVRTEDGRDIESKIKGNFRMKDIKSTNPVAVGDRVVIDINKEGTAFITEIEERKNYIIRRASNLSKQSHIIAQLGSGDADRYGELSYNNNDIYRSLLGDSRGLSCPR